MTTLRGEGRLIASGRVYSSQHTSGQWRGTPPPVTEPITTSMGYQIAKTFTIHESEPVDGAIQYELKVDGESLWVGMGTDRVDGLPRHVG